MFRAFFIASLTAIAAADFTTTLEFRDWLLDEDIIGLPDEEPFGFRGSIVNIDLNKTTIHAQFDQNSGDLPTKYHPPNNTNSFTFTFAPNYISAQVAKPDWWETTYNIDCSEKGDISTRLYDEAANTCTISLWGTPFSSDRCADGAMGIRKSMRSSPVIEESLDHMQRPSIHSYSERIL
jgi:hypothetical protein